MMLPKDGIMDNDLIKTQHGQKAKQRSRHGEAIVMPALPLQILFNIIRNGLVP